MNDLGPVALTSVVTKVCERIALPQLRECLKNFIDPMQFAYRSDRSCEDVISTILKRISSFLDVKAWSEKKKILGLVKSKDSNFA